MMEVALRLAVVAAAAGAVVVAMDRWQRRRPRVRTHLGQGIALVVTPACRLCDVLRDRLEDLGVPHETVRADDARLGQLTLRAAPALLRIDHGGRVAAMRTGRAALAQLHDVVGSSQQRGIELA